MLNFRLNFGWACGAPIISNQGTRRGLCGVEASNSFYLGLTRQHVFRDFPFLVSVVLDQLLSSKNSFPKRFAQTPYGETFSSKTG